MSTHFILYGSVSATLELCHASHASELACWKTEARGDVV